MYLVEKAMLRENILKKTRLLLQELWIVLSSQRRAVSVGGPVDRLMVLGSGEASQAPLPSIMEQYSPVPEDIHNYYN